jgi:hypothetical protein
LIVQAIVFRSPFSELFLECSIHNQPSRQRLYQYIRKNVNVSCQSGAGPRTPPRTCANPPPRAAVVR